MKTLRSWWILGWHWQPIRARGRHLNVSLCLSEINLPRVHWSRDPEAGFVSLDYGNAYSDPVWSISWEWSH